MMEWISVEDFLPDRTGLSDEDVVYALIAYRVGFPGCWFTAICGYTKDGWVSPDGVPVDKIELWMPLAKLP